MAGTLKTTNYQLAKYAPDDITSWLTDFNGNMDLIDAGMQENKQASTQAQDGVDNLEAEYESLLQVVNGHTTSIDANEKAIAANTASIEELRNSINDIIVYDAIFVSDANGTKIEDLVANMSLTARRIGNMLSGFGLVRINTGTLHTYNRQGTGILDNYYITDLIRFTGNVFNLPANVWSRGSIFACEQSGSTVTSSSYYTMGLAYLADSGYTVIGIAESTSTAVTVGGDYVRGLISF